MKTDITINGHSSIRAAGGKVLYFDPFIMTEEPHDADIIFFTHSHFDHFSAEDYPKAAQAGTVFVCPATIVDVLTADGIDKDKIVALKPGDTADVLGIAVEAVPSYNVNKPNHPKSNAWLGYIVTLNGERVYVAGDTDDNPDVRAVKCDVALVPVGGTYTTNAAEAAAVVNAIKPKTAIPTHYGHLVGSNADAETFAKLVDKDIEVVIKIGK